MSEKDILENTTRKQKQKHRKEIDELDLLKKRM